MKTHIQNYLKKLLNIKGHIKAYDCLNSCSCHGLILFCVFQYIDVVSTGVCFSWYLHVAIHQRVAECLHGHRPLNPIRSPVRPLLAKQGMLDGNNLCVLGVSRMLLTAIYED